MLVTQITIDTAISGGTQPSCLLASLRTHASYFGEGNLSVVKDLRKQKINHLEGKSKGTDVRVTLILESFEKMST